MEREILDEALQLYLENYKAKPGELSIFVNCNKAETLQLRKEDFAVTLGKENVPIMEVKTVEETGENITILCLVDVSGSLDEKRMDEMKEVLECLIENLREGDSVCIIAMGDTLRTVGFLTDKTKIQEQIDNLAVLREDTNLYQGVTESLQTLLSGENVCAKRCLLVLSDGAEDNTYGITREEVSATIEESHIPVYTIGMPKNISNQAQMDSVKVLGSFARVSAGGNHYVPKLEDLSGEDIATDIWNDFMSGLVIKTDTSNLYVTGQELYLKVSVDIEDVGDVEVGMNVADSDVVLEIEEEELTEEIEYVEETVEESRSTNNVGLLLLFIVIGLCIIVGILAVLVIRKKKKKKNVETNETENVEEENSQTTDIPETVSEFVPKFVPEIEAGEKLVSDEADTVKKGGLEVRLIRMGIGETKSLCFQIADRVSIGRDKSKADFTLEEDGGLSGIHCVFTYRNSCLYLQDANSTNGTYVNGVPIKSPIRLNQDDVILAGSYEYRICWQKRI